MRTFYISPQGGALTHDLDEVIRQFRHRHVSAGLRQELHLTQKQHKEPESGGGEAGNWHLLLQTSAVTVATQSQRWGPTYPGGCGAMAGGRHPGPFEVTRTYDRARAGCQTCTGANTVALESTSFEERKCFIVRSTSKEIGGTAQIRLPDPGIRAKFKGFR